MAIIKNFMNFFGVDLKSSDITRGAEFARDMRNAEYRKNGNISKRPGHKIASDEGPKFGIKSYRRIEPGTGIETEILVGASDKIYVQEKTSFLVSYTGSSLSVVYEVFYDTASNTYRAQITEGVNIVLNKALGVGKDELTPVTLSDLKADIDAISDFSASIDGDSDIPAAFLELVRVGNLAEGDVSTHSYSWKEVNSTVSSPLPGNETFKADQDFQNTSIAQLNNVVFFSNGYDELIKYDGQTAYKAGLPNGVTPSVAVNPTGALNTTYRYKTVYSQFDAVGNIVESNPSDASADIAPSGESVDITLDNLEAGSGFNTNCAIVSGVQLTTNIITVDDGSVGTHTMKPGDTAYFFNTVDNEYVERKILSITSTSIEIEGDPVSVDDNSVISNNLRIGVYRNLDGGLASFLVEEIPNNSFAATQVLNDNKADSELGIELVEPIFPRDQAPKGRYLATFRNQLFIAGSIENPNFVYWSDVGNPEYFGVNLYALKLQSPNGDKLSGVAKSNETVIVFESKAMHVISGDIPANNLRTDTITYDIGCVSHHTIQEVRGRLYFLSDRGVYSTVSGQLPIAESEIIEPAFDFTDIFDLNDVPVLKRSVAINDRVKEKYILSIPVETILDGEIASEKTIGIVQDYFRKSWLIWDNIDLTGGADIHQDGLGFVERRPAVSTVRHYFYKQLNRNDNWDYIDHDSAVNFIYDTAWYHLGTPTVFKKYLRFKLFGANETNANSFKLDIDIARNFQKEVVEGNFTIDYGEGVQGYGISAYGSAPYGDVDSPNRKVKIGPIKAQAISFSMKNSEINENVDLLGWELEFQGQYREEMKE